MPDIGDELAIPNAPDIPGLVFRPYRDERDLLAIVSISNRAFADAGMDLRVSVDRIANQMAARPDYDASRDCFLAEVDGHPVAFGDLEVNKSEDGSEDWTLWGHVEPEWLGRGLGTAIVRELERRSRVRAVRLPAGVARRFSALCTEKNGRSTRGELLANEGYNPVLVLLVMVRPTLDEVPDVPLPEGIEVRHVRQGDVQKILAADRLVWRPNAPLTNADVEEFLHRKWTDISLWRVTWQGDEVAGQVKSFINQDENEQFARLRGYTEYISVPSQFRRRGIARHLLALSLVELRNRGMSEAALITAADNPALSLYESMGFRTVERQFRVFKAFAAERGAVETEV